MSYKLPPPPTGYGPFKQGVTEQAIRSAGEVAAAEAQAAGLANAARNTASGTRDAARFGAYGNLAQGIGQGWGAGTTGLAGGYASGVTGMASALGYGLSGLGTAASNVAGAQATGLSGLGSALGSGLSGLGQGYATGASGLGNALAYGQAGLGQSLASGLGNVAGAYGNVGSAIANATGVNSGALANLGGATANNFGAYSTGLAGLGNALSNERQAAYNSMSQAEAARQLAAGNIATQALAAYGSLGNSAMSAWGQNQQAYNAALANMAGSSQTGISQLGQSRNQALAGLANSASGLGIGMSASQALGGGGGFSATSPTGSIASGTYGGGGQFDPTAGAVAAGQLDATRAGIQDNSYLTALNRQADADRRSLNAQQAMAAGMPLAEFNNSFDRFRALANDGYGAGTSGMNDYFSAMAANRPDFAPLARDMGAGFANSSRALAGLGGRMSDDFASGINAARRTTDGLEEVRGDLTGGIAGLSEGVTGGVRSLGRDLSRNMGQFGRSLMGGVGSLADQINDPTAYQQIGSLAGGLNSGIGTMQGQFFTGMGDAGKRMSDGLNQTTTGILDALKAPNATGNTGSRGEDLSQAVYNRHQAAMRSASATPQPLRRPSESERIENLHGTRKIGSGPNAALEYGLAHANLAASRSQVVHGGEKYWKLVEFHTNEAKKAQAAEAGVKSRLGIK